MERLTKRFNGLQDACPKSHNNHMVSTADIANRLAAYEDTGFTPEEIVKLNDFEHSQCAILLVKSGELERKNATLKRALELACEDQTEHCPYALHGGKRACSEYPMRGLRCQDCAPNHYIQQAQEQEAAHEKA